MRKICIAILLFYLPTGRLAAQQSDLGSWNVFNIKYTINTKWSFFGEAQLRSLKFYNNFHYYEYKGGVNFAAFKNLKLSLAAGSYQTYREGGDFVKPKNNDEFRIWPQVVLSQSVGKLKIEQRYRAEFRFTTNGYRNRFRYRLGLSYPFGKAVKGFQPFQVSASNELFFTDKEPYFERNRILLALNYKPTKATTIQMGYLHQFDYRINDETGRDFFQIGYFIELFRKPSATTTPDRDIKDN
jgi:long-subunit fatty acid transport protein